MVFDPRSKLTVRISVPKSNVPNNRTDCFRSVCIKQSDRLFRSVCNWPSEFPNGKHDDDDEKRGLTFRPNYDYYCCCCRCCCCCWPTGDEHCVTVEWVKSEEFKTIECFIMQSYIVKYATISKQYNDSQRNTQWQ